MQLSGEVTVVRNMLNKCFRSIESQYPNNRDVDTLGELLDELHKINGGVQAKITEIRKISLKSIMKPLPRAVRDISKSLGKKIDLKIIGDENRVDTSIAEVLNSCLLHLVKNSMDHGLEMPAQRVELGKPEHGTIIVNCIERFEEVWIEISDDGKGLIPSAIKNKLLKNGNHTAEEINAMSPQELNMMIFSPGFSTAEKVTDISGRGVGLSMVKESVDKIHGKIEIETAENAGTKFRLILPIPKSVLIASCLSVSSSNSQFGFLQDDITKVLQIEPEKEKEYIFDLNGSKTIVIDDEIIPFVNLSSLLHSPSETTEISKNPQYAPIATNTDSAKTRVVILGPQQDSRKVAIAVDAIYDVEDTVIKTIHPAINSHFLFKGVTYLDNGALGIIMDSNGILNSLNLTEHTKKMNTSTQSKVTNVSTNKKPSLSVVVVQLNGSEYYAIPQADVIRLEEFEYQSLSNSGGSKVIPYNGKVIQVIDISSSFNTQAEPSGLASLVNEIDSEKFTTLICKLADHLIALKVVNILDMCDAADVNCDLADIDAGITGHFFYQNHTVAILDIPKIYGNIKFFSQNELQTSSTDGENEKAA